MSDRGDARSAGLPRGELERGAPVIGAIIVTYGSADVIRSCLDSLFDSQDAEIRIVVVDNLSPDATLAEIRAWATDRGVALQEVHSGAACPEPASTRAPVTLLRSSANLGYAGGVNLGIETLSADPDVGLFWIVNPDCTVTPDAASAFLRKASAVGDFALMGGRVLYTEPPNRIQSDGGRVSRWTGVCHSVNQGRLPGETPPAEAVSLDFISGASLIASRKFIKQAGLLRDDYFLYYEEVDWALRRGDLPLVICDDALVYHEGGTAIGSGSITRRASAFANYFNYRSRIRFLWRFNRAALPGACAYAVAKAVQLMLQKEFDAAWGLLAGTCHLPQPAAVRRRLSGE